MSTFGSLKTIKLERTLGDSILSITTHIPTDDDVAQAFDTLDAEIIQSASNLRDFTGNESTPSKPKSVKKETKAEVKEEKEVADKPKKNKKGAGRPKGSTKKPKPEGKPSTTKKVAEKIETLVEQEEKVALIGKFQKEFEDNIGYTSEDTYMDEFNEFLTSLISMDYETFLEADVTEGQLKTFEALI